MMKRKKKTLIFSLVIGACCLGGATFVQAEAEFEKKFTADLFLPSDIRIESACVPDSGEDMSLGVCLTTTKGRDSEIYFRNNIAGAFSLDFAPLVTNDTITLQEVEFTFTEVESGDSFSAFVLYGTTVNVGVKLEDERAGLYYSNKTLLGLTTFANSDNMYTQVSDERVTLKFDPSDMSLYADGILVWNFLQNEQDGRDIGGSFNPFGEYQVSISMNDYIGVSTSMMLYSVNSCTLDKVVLDDVGTPTVSAAFQKNGLVRQTYELPKGYGYDVWEGLLEVENEVVSPGQEIIAKNVNSFLPVEVGEYKIVYSTKNSEGVTASAEYFVQIIESIPECIPELLDEIPETAYVGESIYVPEMHVYGGLLYYGYENAKVDVACNGVKQLVYSGRMGGFDYPLNYEGTYTFSYTVGDDIKVYTTVVTKPDWRFDFEYQEIYTIGDYIDLTAGTLLVNEEQTAYTVTVRYPSGNVYQNGKIILNESGLYCASLKTEGGFTVEQWFEVKERSTDSFSFTSNDVAVKYGKSSITGLSGITVTSTSNRQTVNYKNPINLGKYVNQTRESTNGTIVRGENKPVLCDTATPFIEFSVEPQEYGVRMLNYIEITLTDAADPNNNVHILISSAGATGGWTYISAGAGTQGYAGLHQGDPGKWFTYDEPRTNAYGLYTHHSFTGKTSSYPANKSVVRLYYDNKQKQILTEPGASQRGATESNCIVADFDNNDFCYGTPWTGFTSDEVYLSFTMGTLNASNATCIIYSVDGMNFSSEYIEYDVAPRFIETEMDALEGVKGQSLPIPIMTAYDANGELLNNVHAYVYYIVGEREYSVEVNNGKFRTVRAGKYRIRYIAEDKFGNIGTEELEVNVHETYATLEASVNTLEMEFTTGKTGTPIALAPLSNLIVENALGKVTSEIKVFFDGTEIRVEDGEFNPERAGKYTVTYILTDGTGRTTTANYEIAIELETEPVIVSSVPVYVEFVRGNIYEIKDIYIKDCTLETIEPILATVYLNGERYNGKTYEPATLIEAKDIVEQEETVVLEYKYGDSLIKKYEIPLRTVYKKYDKKLTDTITAEETAFLSDRYFLTEGGANLTLNSTTMQLTATADGAKFTFAQPLLSKNLSFGFDIAVERSEDLSPVETGVERVRIRIIDANDESKVLVFVIERTADGETKAFVGGEECSVAFSGSLTGTSLNAFLIRLDNADKSFYDGNTGGKLISVKCFENGEEFSGFSDFVYLTVTVDVVDGQTGVLQNFIFNGHRFSADSDDRTAPQIIVNGVFEGTYLYTSSVKIPTATASDVMSDISAEGVRVTITYMSDDGSELPAYDVNGIELTNLPATVEYELRLDRIGEYKISYFVKDTRKGSSSEVVLLQSYITQEPVLTINGNIPTTVRVGEKIKIPDFTATYAEGSTDNLCYAVYIAPNGVYSLLQSGEFTPMEKGLYKLRFLALDEYGNYALVEYKIMVTE